jgi:hypothetical protein
VEASEREDLLVPGTAEPLVHPARALVTCGVASALVLSERIEFRARGEMTAVAGKLIRRERAHLRVVGEAQAADFMMSVLVLTQAGAFREATQMLLSWIYSVATVNAPGSPNPLPDPYHGVEEILLAQIRTPENPFEDEDFDGSAYTLHLAVRWAARRLWRQFLGRTWPAITRIQHHEFRPGEPVEYLYPLAATGSLRSWYYPCPTSWRELCAQADEREIGVLPEILLERAEFVPFLCLALPYRFTSSVADFLDDAIDGASRQARVGQDGGGPRGGL